MIILVILFYRNCERNRGSGLTNHTSSMGWRSGLSDSKLRAPPWQEPTKQELISEVTMELQSKIWGSMCVALFREELGNWHPDPPASHPLPWFGGRLRESPHLDESAEYSEEPVLAVDCTPNAVSPGQIFPILLIAARRRRGRVTVHAGAHERRPEAPEEARGCAREPGWLGAVSPQRPLPSGMVQEPVEQVGTPTKCPPKGQQWAWNTHVSIIFVWNEEGSGKREREKRFSAREEEEDGDCLDVGL